MIASIGSRNRPYRRGRTSEEASALLRQGAGTHFDPRVVSLFLENLPEFEREIAALGLNQHGFTREECEPRALLEDGSSASGDLIKPERAIFAPPAYLDQIRNAHRSIRAYELARAFGSSLDIQATISALVNKVGLIVPFDTCVVYLYDGMKRYATAAHVAGRNREALADRCVAPGEGVVGFVLANRLPASHLDPMLDFKGVPLTEGAQYLSMIALPLVKDERLLGALAVYSFEPRRYTDDHIPAGDVVRPIGRARQLEKHAEDGRTL